MTNRIHRELLLFIFLLASFAGSAQDLPIYNSYFSNPFFYNPSYSIARKKAELNLLYRQQWSGINGAPKFSFLTLTAPISKKMGFGINLYNNTRGVMMTNSAQASFSYKVEFTDHTSLSFGLSAGLGKNSLDQSQVDVNDPTVQRALNSSFYWQGQAGFNLQHRSLNIGFSLPQIFGPSQGFNNSFQNTAIAPFNVAVASVTSKFEISPTLTFQPLLLDKIGSGTTTNQWEAYGIVYYKDAIWLGGLYRQNGGPAVLTGFQIVELLSIGYSYEFAPSQLSSLNFNTHEFRILIRFGKELSSNQGKSHKGYNSPPSSIRNNHYRRTHH